MNALSIKARFPILQETVDGRPLVYLDSAASSQKPDAVVEAMRDYYVHDNANVYRGVYRLAARSTERYEAARARVAAFIGALPEELIFTRGSTESLNLVAWAWARQRLGPGDEILTTVAEHHSNLVPWQEVSRATGAELRFIDLTPEGEITEAAVKAAITPRTRLVAVHHASNVLGTLAPVKAIAAAAHRVGALVIVDGAQSVPHMAVDVKDLDVDFLAFSGHKMLGPMGIGGLYGKTALLREMGPFHTGGEMISHVDPTASTFKEPPQKFEAGTPNVAGAIVLAEAVGFLEEIGMSEIEAHDRALGEMAAERLREIPEVEVYGPRGPRTGVVSFNLEGLHPHDLATSLDSENIAVRAGHHCCQPLMHHLGAPSTARASFYLYNTEEDVDRLVEGVLAAREFFGHVLR